MSQGNQGGGAIVPSNANGTNQTDTNLFRASFKFAYGGRSNSDTWDTTFDIRTMYDLPGGDWSTKIIQPIAEVLQNLMLPQVYFMRAVVGTVQKGDSVRPYRRDNLKVVGLNGQGRRDMQESDVIDLNNCLSIGLIMDTGRNGSVNLRGALRERDLSANQTGHSVLTGDILLPQFIQPFQALLTEHVADFQIGVISEIPVGNNIEYDFVQCVSAQLNGVSIRPMRIDRVSKNVQLKNARKRVLQLEAEGVTA